MTTVHKPFSFIGGDDWRFNVILQDENEDPFDLTGIEIRWLLHNQRGQIVPHDFSISLIEPTEGLLSIWIPATATTKFAGGLYTDWLRIVSNGITSTLMTGLISVTADPWTAAIMPAAAIGRSTADVIVILSRRERIVRRPLPEPGHDMPHPAVMKRNDLIAGVY